MKKKIKLENQIVLISNNTPHRKTSMLQFLLKYNSDEGNNVSVMEGVKDKFKFTNI